ncbi:MAG: pyrroline-5-carboxylate reductase [Chitinophagales bacterium]|nr:pyrroline-5-carboxylate reductase [Chitinophagales bacterium]
MKNKIAIIGGGNLGVSIAEGLLKSKFCKPADLTVTRRKLSALSGLAKKGVNVLGSNPAAVKNSDVIILAVKPFQAADVLNGIKKELTANKILVSVVTGVMIDEMEESIKKKLAYFRAMPNTAIAIQESMTCLCSKYAKPDDEKFVFEMFSRLGKVVYINENLMDASTVLGACGTAYAMRYIRASTQGGIEIGFDAKTASLIAAQTVKGAAELLLQNGSHPEQEIDKVTTPKGCTIAGLNEMEHQGFSSALIRGIMTSYNKIK